MADLQGWILAETFDLDDGDRLRLPAFPLEMDIRVFEVGKARRVVFETVEKGPLQDPQIDLLFGEKLLGFQTLVPRISREGLEVPFDETPPRLELEESGHGSLEFLDGRLAFFPAAPGGDELSRDEREPVGDDLLPGEDVEDEQLLRGRVDFDRLVLVPGGGVDSYRPGPRSRLYRWPSVPLGRAASLSGKSSSATAADGPVPGR